MRLVVRLCLGSISHKLESPDHLTNSEEANDLSEDHARRHHLFAFQAPYTVQDVRWLCGAGVCEGTRLGQKRGWLAESVDGWLVVTLEGSEVSVVVSVWQRLALDTVELSTYTNAMPLSLATSFASSTATLE